MSVLAIDRREDFRIRKGICLHGFAQQFFTRVPCIGSYVLNLYQKQEREAAMLTRKQKTYSILDDEIDEDNVVVGHKSVTRSTDSNKKRFKKEIIEGQDDDDDEEIY